MLGCPGYRTGRKGRRQDLGRTDAVYTEIPSDLPSMLALLPKMMLPGGKTIDKVISPALTAEVEKELKIIDPDFTLQPIAKFKPWAVAAMLLELGDQLKYPGTLAMDMIIFQRQAGKNMIIFQRAALAGKETGGLETPDEQVAVFDGFTEAEQISMISDTIRQMRELRAAGHGVSDYLAELYLAGDLDHLVGELNKLDAGSDPKLTEKFLDRLLYRRNALMAERIVRKLREHPDTSFFFAIGAAHLQGDRGVLAALEKAGFRLTRVP